MYIGYLKWYDIGNLSDINFDNTLKLSDIFLVSDITLGLDYIITLESSDITLELYTIIDFWWGLLMTMKTASGIGWPTPKADTASGIGWPTPKAEVNQYLTRSSWSWVDRNQKSIIALLNYREFSFTKIEISIATAFYRAR